MNRITKKQKKTHERKRKTTYLNYHHNINFLKIIWIRTTKKYQNNLIISNCCYYDWNDNKKMKSLEDTQKIKKILMIWGNLIK